MTRGYKSSNSSQKGQAFDREVVEAFASLFKGRTDCWGKISSPRGKCIYETVTLDYYRRHLEGEISLGVYFNLDDSTCHFAAIDIDDFDFGKAKTVRNALKSIGIPAYIAASKRNHHHIFIFAEDHFVSREIRQILIHVRDELGIKTDKGAVIEVFPKQGYHEPDSPPSEKHPEGEKHPGSYINLPCFGFTRPFLAADRNGNPHEIPLTVALKRIQRTPNEVIQRILKTLPGEPPEKETRKSKQEYKEQCGFNWKKAVENLLTNCAFMAYCADHAATLSEPEWFTMLNILSFFSEPGREEAHKLSKPHPEYTEAETNQKIDNAKKAADKGIGPYLCSSIQEDLNFECPDDCLAKKWGLKSPVVLANRLARNAGLPTIVCSGRHLREKSTDALQALYQANSPERIFHRGGALFRISKDELNRPMIELLMEAALRGHMERSANFINHNSKGEAVILPPPLEVVRDVGSLGDWRFPALWGITEAPIIRPDGTVLATPGYDSATHLYYAPAPGLVVPPIPENPTDSEVRAATELLLEGICDFPFVDEASHANAVGALMVPILRPLMGLAPMAVLDKPQPGTGASLLADVISIVATGRSAATMGDPRSEEECEKKLNSHLLEGRSLCVIDNVDGKLWSDTLARFLTSTYLSVRPLGRSADLNLQNSLIFIVTGNNIQLGGDLPRRCFWIRLNAQVARPWLRDGFRHPRLQEWLAENRGAILAAVLTIARAWVVAGRPENPELLVLGGYEGFCCVVGNILDFMGVRGFLANLTAMYDTMDKDTPQWEAFLETWREVIGDVPVTTKELNKKLGDSEELSNSLPESLATRDERNYSRRLGNALAKRAEVHHPNGLVLVKAGTTQRATLWRVIKKIANSPVFSFKSELRELGNTLPHTEKSGEDKNIYIKGVGANSPNSHLATQGGELAEDIGAVNHKDPWDKFLREVEGED